MSVSDHLARAAVFTGLAFIAGSFVFSITVSVIVMIHHLF